MEWELSLCTLSGACVRSLELSALHVFASAARAPVLRVSPLTYLKMSQAALDAMRGKGGKDGDETKSSSADSSSSSSSSSLSSAAASPTAAALPPAAASDKDNLKKLVQLFGPGYTLSESVEEFLSNYADHFVTDLVSRAASVAAARRSTGDEVDVFLTKDDIGAVLGTSVVCVCVCVC